MKTKTVMKLKLAQQWLKRITESRKQVNEKYRREMAVVKLIQDRLDQLSFDAIPDFCGTNIDFNYLEHEKTVELIKVFGGKWKKDYQSDSINYTQEEPTVVFEDREYRVRVYCGKPPPNCKLVECGEEWVPGYSRKKFKIECQGGTDSQIADGSANAVVEATTATDSTTTTVTT